MTGYRFNGTTARRLRNSKALTTEHIGAAIGRSTSAIRAYEADIVDPPASVVGRLAGVLGVGPCELFSPVDTDT